MNRLKSIAKTVVGEALLRTGLWRRHLEKMARRDEAMILIYHRVIEKWDRTLDYSQPGLVVTADTFERQLTFLKKYFDIVPLSSLISDFEFRISKCSDLRDVESANPQSEIPNSKSSGSGTPNPQSAIRHPSLANSKSEIRNSKPRCVITFDDGWRDNYEIAFPILNKHGLPATIFLTTDFIGTSRPFWHTELMYLLMHGDLSRFKLTQYVLDPYPASVRSGLMRLAHMEQAPGADDVDALIEAVKATCDEPTSDQLIGDLGTALGFRRPLFSDRRFFLDWDQVREMHAAGIEMGSHGCSHRSLTQLEPEEAEEEMTLSKAEIETRIGQAVQHFAFPYGAANADLMALVGKAGYRTASLCQAALDGRRKELLALRRLGMHEGVSSLSLWLLRSSKETRA